MPSPKTFKPADTRLFFSRGDASDPRLGDAAHAVTIPLEASSHSRPKTNTVYLAGYPDDDGIGVNGGRRGASQAPDAVRKPLYKMTPNVQRDERRELDIRDVGNLNVGHTPELEQIGQRHREVTRVASQALSEGASWVGIGGGHDYGFADACAYIDWARADGHRPLVINFDAHLDVRPLPDPDELKVISSGTPFYRMLTRDPDVDFAEIGLQAHCNARSHLDWVLSKGARVYFQESALSEDFTSGVIRTLGDWIPQAGQPRRPIYLSVDIDGFSSSVAPGCSQSWATGFSAGDFFKCLEKLLVVFEVKVLGIYEVSPPLDQDDRTAKLAAQIIHRVIA